MIINTTCFHKNLNNDTAYATWSCKLKYSKLILPHPNINQLHIIGIDISIRRKDSIYQFKITANKFK